MFKWGKSDPGRLAADSDASAYLIRVARDHRIEGYGRIRQKWTLRDSLIKGYIRFELDYRLAFPCGSKGRIVTRTPAAMNNAPLV